MAIRGEGISFHPLYWVFNDNWKYWKLPTQPNTPPPVYKHRGHVHFFMLGYNWNVPNQDAFTGSQQYTMEIEDVWGPRSSDPNQMTPYHVVGTPKWYFTVQEVWRRVYIQPWDVSEPRTPVPLRRGLKWEATAPDKRAGPFREGRRLDGTINAPVWITGARTLPLDYYTSDEALQIARTNHLATMARETLGDDAYIDEVFNLQHGNFLPAEGPDAHPAAKPTFSDALYIWPLIEYQTVTQMSGQRLPDYGDRDIDADHFGDGWSVDIGIPFVNPVTGRYNSPFGSVPGEVKPIGQYYGTSLDGAPLVPEANRYRYAGSGSNPPADVDDVLGQPSSTLGQLLSWHNPFGTRADGRWVQQCLGGVVTARAVVTLEHAFGGRQDVAIDTTIYKPTTAFAGTDQDAPAP